MLDGKIVLFQGDSITDAGRDYSDANSLGEGYPAVVAKRLPAARIINRGISGNRAADLVKRWSVDCIALRPDVVTILIGINDTWRRYDRNDPTSAQQYEDSYRCVLNSTRELGAQIVIMEPFVLPYPSDRAEWRVDLDPKIHVARKLAVEFGALYVPLDGIFAAHAARVPYADLLPDGVHPTAKGHEVIACSWLEAMGIK